MSHKFPFATYFSVNVKVEPFFNRVLMSCLLLDVAKLSSIGWMLSHRGSTSYLDGSPYRARGNTNPRAASDARAVAFRRLDRLSGETAAPSGNVPAVQPARRATGCRRVPPFLCAM